MGSRLISGITSQLQGQSRYEKIESGGSRFVLDFPLEDTGYRTFKKVAGA